MKRKIGIIGIILAFAVGLFCYAETVGVGIWDYTNNNDYWYYIDGDLVPGTDNTVTIGASGTEVKNIHLETITLAGTPYTSLAMGSDGNWTGMGTTTTLDAAPTKFVATHSSGQFLCTILDTDDITGTTNDQTIDLSTNNKVIFGDNSDTFTVEFDATDTILQSSNGAIVVKSTQADGEVHFKVENDSDNYLAIQTNANVPTIATLGTSNLAIVPDGGTTAITGILTVSGAQTLTGATTATSLIIGDDTYDVVTDDQFRFASNNEETTIEAYGYADKDAVLQLSTDQGADAGDKWQLVSDHSTNSMFFTNDTGVKDTHATVLTLAKTGIMTTTAAINVEKDDASASGVADVLNLQHFTTGTGAVGIGVSATFDLENATGVEEEHASIDVVSAVATNDAEDTDLVVNLMTNGALAEVFRIDNDNEADAGAVFELTSRTEETNDVIDMLELKLDNTTDTADDGMGLGISILMDDETDVVEQQASMDFVLTDVATTAENVDFILSLNTIGTIREALRVDVDSTATATSVLEFTSYTLQTDGIVDILELKLDNTLDTSAANFGAGISIQLDDETDTVEEQASIDFTLTDAGSTTEDCDVIFSQNVAGVITERVRFDADGANILLSGATPSIIVGDDDAEDTSIVFDGNAKEYYVGIDDAGSYPDDLVIGMGSAVGTTAAIAVDENQHVAFIQEVTVADALTLSAELLLSNETVTCTAADPQGLGTADPDKVITFIVTNATGSSYDLVTLADGTTGEVKIFVYKTDLETSGVSVRPANMAGGANILFEDAGDGCTMVFDGTNWTVVSNNGATISD